MIITNSNQLHDHLYEFIQIWKLSSQNLKQLIKQRQNRGSRKEPPKRSKGDPAKEPSSSSSGDSSRRLTRTCSIGSIYYSSTSTAGVIIVVILVVVSSVLSNNSKNGDMFRIVAFQDGSSR